MTSKKRVAVFAATGCRGCDQTVLDLYERLNFSCQAADFAFWPYRFGSSLEELDEGQAFDVCFFSGCIRTEDDLEAAEVLRSRSGLLVALGACAAFGGIAGLGNLGHDGHQASQHSRDDSEPPVVPKLTSEVMSLDHVSPVDYYVPGCPPNPDFLWSCFQALFQRPVSKSAVCFGVSHLPEPVAASLLVGIEPPKGTVFAGPNTVCAGCPRRKEDKTISVLRRLGEIQPDPERCLLEQGLVCLGIVTREGCGGICTALGVPCRGCYGGAASISDPGIRFISAVGSMFQGAEAGRVQMEIDKLKDLPGTLYRYNLASQCLLTRKK